MNRLTPEQFDDLLGRVATADHHERRACLEDLRHRDPFSAEEMARCLRALEEDGDFLAEPIEVPLDEILESRTSPVVEAHGELPLPAEIGPYRLVEQLGRGGGGLVFRAEQRLPEREVAVKLLPIQGVAAQRDLLAHEANTLASLDHPGIARVYDARIVDEGTRSLALIAMEYVEGGQQLDHFLVRENPDSKEIVDLFIQITDAISHAHQKGVIHRDLKPANVLVRPDRGVRVIDFGLAGIDGRRGPLDIEGAVIGSWRYMSPEHVEGVLSTDTRSDVYSLGVMLREMLTGHHPYADKAGEPGQIARVLNDPSRRRPYPAGVDADLRAVIEKAMDIDPPERYQSASELLEDLGRWRNGYPVTARRGSPLHAARLLAVRRPVTFWTAVAACLGLTATSVTTTSMWLRSDRLLADLEASSELLRKTTEAERQVRDEFITLQDGIAAAMLGDLNAPAGNSGTFDIVAATAEQVGAGGTLESKRAVIGRSVETLDRLRTSAGADAGLTRSIARTYERLADLIEYDWFASPDEARVIESALHGAVGTWEAIIESSPSDLEAIRSLALAKLRLSQNARQRQERVAAYELGDQAVRAARRAHEISEGGADASVILTHALHARGDAAIGSTMPPERGLADSQEAVAVMEAAIARHGATPRLTNALSWSEFRVAAWLQGSLGRPGDGLPHRRRANDLLVSNITGESIDRDSLEDLVRYYAAEIVALHRYGDAAETIDRAREVFHACADAAERAGLRPEYRGWFVSSTAETVRVLDRLGAQGESDWIVERLRQVTREAGPETRAKLQEILNARSSSQGG